MVQASSPKGFCLRIRSGGCSCTVAADMMAAVQEAPLPAAQQNRQRLQYQHVRQRQLALHTALSCAVLTNELCKLVEGPSAAGKGIF